MENKDLYIRSSAAEFLIFEQQKKEKGIEYCKKAKEMAG